MTYERNGMPNAVSPFYAGVSHFNAFTDLAGYLFDASREAMKINNSLSRIDASLVVKRVERFTSDALPGARNSRSFIIRR